MADKGTNHLARNWRIWALGAMLACLLAGLLAHAYIGSFSRIMSDTYCYAERVHSEGFVRAQWAWYTSWTGRYSFNFAESLTGLIGPEAPPYLPAVALLVWMSALAGTLLQFRLAAKRSAAFLASALLGALILFVTLDSIPAVDQSLYWSDAMHNYVPPLILLTIFVGVVRYRQERQWQLKSGIPWLALSTGLTLVASGFTEMYGALQVTALSIALAAGWLIGSPKFRRNALPLVAAGLLGALVGIAIVIIAPGNRVRQAACPPSPGLLTLASLSLTYAWQYVVQAMGKSPLGIVGTLVLPALLAAGVLTDDGTVWRPWIDVLRPLLWIPALAFVLIVSAFVASTYGLSAPPPERSLIVPQYVLACALVVWAYSAGLGARQVGVGRILGREAAIWKAVAGCATVVFALYVLLAAQHVLAREPQVAAYAAAWDEAYRLVREAQSRGAQRVAVPPLPNPTGSGEIGSDPEWWINQCASGYYHVTVLTHPTPQAPSETDLDRMTHLDACISNVAQVLGYTLDRTTVGPGEKLTVTVYWRPGAATERPYTVFVHLYDPATGIIAQADGYPMRGEYPTTSWVYGYPFADRYELALPDRMPATAEADLILGLYDLQTMERLPVTGQDTNAGTRSVQLGGAQVRP